MWWGACGVTFLIKHKSDIVISIQQKKGASLWLKNLIFQLLCISTCLEDCNSLTCFPTTSVAAFNAGKTSACGWGSVLFLKSDMPQIRTNSSSCSNKLPPEADNCVRESKNSNLIRFLSFLTSSQRIKLAALSFGRVGHTHGCLGFLAADWKTTMGYPEFSLKPWPAPT